jgi:predicted metal-binding protein
MENEMAKYNKFFLVYSQFNIAEYIKKEKEVHPTYGEKRIRYFFYINHHLDGYLEKEMDIFLKNYSESYNNILPLYAGTCKLCRWEGYDGCTFDDDIPCRFPERKRYSMEAVGIEVIKTVLNLKNKDFEYPSKIYEFTFGLICLK